MNSSGTVDKDQLIQQLEVENELKTKWIALLVHDFKGLFSNVHWLLNAYEKKIIPEDLFLTMLPELNQQVEKNQNTFLDTCEWIRTQIDGADLPVSEINVLQLFTAIKEELMELWTKKEITFEFVGDSALFLRNDQVLTRFILRKIVENAIKYSYHGGRIGFEAKGNSSVVQISIQDKGMGMNLKVMESLFTLKGNPNTGTQNEKGTGLSLVIVKDFMNRLGGKLEVFSDEDNGTVFKLLFPIKE